MNYSQDKIVEVIEDGRIVRVSETYARREGLPILRKPKAVEDAETAAQAQAQTQSKAMRNESRLGFIDTLYKPADWREKQVMSELVDNFNWVIRDARKRKGLNRKQVAKMINEEEESVRILEHGRLPSKDFIIINKIQKALGINLRKDGKNFDFPIGELKQKSEPPAKKEKTKEKTEKDEMFSGKDIEIFDDDL